MSNKEVPAEYLSYDFGFSAIDESEVLKRNQSDEPMEIPGMSDDIRRIEEKIDSLTNLMYKFGDNFDENVSDTELKNKIKQLEAIIVPLLNNLLKTADKEYIYWPNRRDTVQKQLDKVLEITRG
jgi:hypothetical protein